MCIIEADVIIAGGGTCGCVIAGRLADARPDLSIVILESGVETDQRVSKPLDSLFTVYENASHIRYVRSKPLPQLDGRAPVVPVGNLVGGSSSINFMMYNNAAASDFDDWDTPGWSFVELQPFVQKSEAWPRDSDAVHGREGRMPVSKSGTPYDQSYFDAFRLAKDVPFSNDIVNYRTAHACGHFPKFISESGKRSNTVKAYLTDRGHLDNPQIRLLTSTTISRVIFEGDQAVGVQAVRETTPITVKARLVVVTAGAFGSPMLLERSGIGCADLLAGLGIDVQVDLPGVGADYQDHELTICSYKVTDDAPTLDHYARGEKAAADAEWEQTGGGIVASNGFDFGYKIRPTDADIEEMGPIFAKHWNTIDKPDKPLYSGPMVNYFMGPHPRPSTGRYVSMGAFLNYPAGRGSVHISSPDPLAPPNFDAGLLSHPADLPPHVWAYKIQREVARRMPYYLGEHVASHPIFPPGSNAALQMLDQPRQLDEVKSLQYTAEDDQAIVEWVKRTVGTAYHSISTCAMKPREKGGVVDSRLNVYGTRNLKVADLSICPANLGTNTTTVALLVGEKAASLILEELED